MTVPIPLCNVVQQILHILRRRRNLSCLFIFVKNRASLYAIENLLKKNTDRYLQKYKWLSPKELK